MNKANYILNGILVIAVIVLFLLYSNNNSNSAPAKQAERVADTSVALNAPDFKMAYVNLDTVLLNYNLYKELEQKLVTEQKSAERRFQRDASVLQGKVNEYQENAMKGLITRAEAEQTEAKLRQEQQNLMALEQQLNNDLMSREQEMQARLYDSIQKKIKTFNSDKKYSVILNNAFKQSILDAPYATNITDTVLTLLNTAK